MLKPLEPRAYRGPLKAVIFDWAGTMVDFGSCAPMATFVEVFARRGVPTTIEEVRRPMGLPKIDHIRALGADPAVAARWKAATGRPFEDADAHALLGEFVLANLSAVRAYSGLIPGALDAVADARRRGLKIGSTTGYTRAIMDVLAPLAADQGYRPDCIICADEIAGGRPAPLMMYKAFVELGAWPAAACVKVDDTAPGVAEGLAAGCWTVGVAVTGNGMGLTAQEIARLAANEFARRRQAARSSLEAAGAHVVVDSVAELPRVLDAIEYAQF